MDENKKNILKSLAAVGLSVGGLVAAKALYHKIFQRLERPDYDIYPGLYDYKKVEEVLPRTTFTFTSVGNKLTAYYYESKQKPKGLIVLVHGFHSGSDDYLPIIMFFVEHGYNVFSYDGCGTYESEGKDLRGFSQGLVDLDNALNFIKKDKRFKKQKLFLFGHSCGGFAVNTVINYHPKDVEAVASIAAVNNCYKLILEKGDQYAGEVASQGFPKDFLDSYQKTIFGKYVRFDAVSGVNKTKIPFFIAHGNNDKTISYEEQSLISHRDEITNPNVTYMTTSGNQSGHTSIWHSKRSNEYQEEVDKTIKKMKSNKKTHDEIAEYVSTVNHELYSEINLELFETVIKIFDKESKKFSPFKLF